VTRLYYWLDKRGMILDGLFLFTTVFRLALGCTQPLVEWVLGALSPGHAADHSPSCSAKVKNLWSCTSPPHTSWHGS